MNIQAALERLRHTGRLCWARTFGPAERYWHERLRLDAEQTDMVDDPGERFYAQLYLEAMASHLPDGRPLRVLDAGCQSGRLAIPLAQDGHQVVGIDVSPAWLARCRAHCERAGVNVELVCEDAAQAARRFPSGSFDVVICTELLYALRNYAEILRGFRTLLRDGGRLFASHRTRYYLLSTLLRYRQFGDLTLVRDKEEGEVLGGYFNWFEEETLRRIYADADYEVAAVTGIGAFSGLGADGLAAVLDPSTLTSGDRASVLGVERELGERYRHVARYLFISADAGAVRR